MTESEKKGNEKKVDEGWKERAGRERDASEQVENKDAPRKEETVSHDPKESETQRTLPKPTFPLLLSTMASQVYIFLGDIANPLTGEREKDLAQAKYTIDMLQILKEKTEGNVSEDEKKLFDSLIFELRMRYINASGGAG